MKKNMSNLSSLLIFVAGGILFTGCGPSADQSGWLGPNRNGVITGFEMPDNWPDELTKVWQVEVGLGDASPVLANDSFFLSVMQDSTEMVLCLDAKDGQVIWETSIQKSPEIVNGAKTHPGPRSTPAVQNHRVYLLTTTGSVICLDARQGEVLWKNDAYEDLVPRFLTSASPLLVGGLCVLHLGDHDDGVVVALDQQTGSIAWTYGKKPCTYSSAATLADDKLVIQSETSQVGLSLEGELLWEIPTPTKRGYYSSPTPVVHDHEVYITGQGYGTSKYELKQVEGKWEPDSLWTNEEFGTSYNTPVYKDGLLFGTEALRGYVFCLDAETGTTCWADTVKRHRFASMMDLGEVMLTVATNKMAVFFEPTGDAFHSFAEYQVAESDNYTFPVVEGNRIYIKDEKTLICWEL